MDQLDQFFGSVIKPESKERFDDAKIDKMIGEMSFICAEEFGWSQEDFESCDIPYLRRLLDIRSEKVKERNKQMRRKR